MLLLSGGEDVGNTCIDCLVDLNTGFLPAFVTKYNTHWGKISGSHILIWSELEYDTPILLFHWGSHVSPNTTNYSLLKGQKLPPISIWISELISYSSFVHGLSQYHFELVCLTTNKPKTKTRRDIKKVGKSTFVDGLRS